MRRTAAWGAEGRFLAEGDRARVADLLATCELDGIIALELALEEPVQLGVARRLLAVRHADGIGLYITS